MSMDHGCPIFNRLRPRFRPSSPSQRESDQADSTPPASAAAAEPSKKASQLTTASWAHYGKIGGGAWQPKKTLSPRVGLASWCKKDFHCLSLFTIIFQIDIHESIFLGPRTNHDKPTPVILSLEPCLFDCKTELCNLVALASQRVCPKIVAMYFPHTATWKNSICFVSLPLCLFFSLMDSDGAYVRAYVISSHTFLRSSQATDWDKTHCNQLNTWPSWGIWGPAGCGPSLYIPPRLPAHCACHRKPATRTLKQRKLSTSEPSRSTSCAASDVWNLNSCWLYAG